MPSDDAAKSVICSEPKVFDPDWRYDHGEMHGMTRSERIVRYFREGTHSEDIPFVQSLGTYTDGASLLLEKLAEWCFEQGKPLSDVQGGRSRCSSMNAANR